MDIKPLHDRVAVKASPAEEVTATGIIIPDVAKEKPMHGEVIAVGTGKIAENGTVTPLTLKKGDKVLYGKYSGTEVTIDGEELLIMRESDVYAILDQKVTVEELDEILSQETNLKQEKDTDSVKEFAKDLVEDSAGAKFKAGAEK